MLASDPASKNLNDARGTGLDKVVPWQVANGGRKFGTALSLPFAIRTITPEWCGVGVGLKCRVIHKK